ncbi:glycosyl transferase family protein [Halomonas sp. GFAJ-1]|nr:hypothetical protein BB497_09485 [Halomonas sp. GFAJ-1]EHK62032.1 glycosyl transferase family protein [Halomonas sp. GFAJ-1]
MSDLTLTYQYIDATVLEDIEQMTHPINRNAIVKKYGRMLTKGEVSCFLSHRKIWQEVIAGGKLAVIFEDDALIDEDIKHFLDCLAMEPVAFDVVLLGHSKKDYRHKKMYHFLEPLKNGEPLGTYTLGRGFKTWPSGAVGYVITPAGAEKLLAASRTICCVLDDWPYYENKGVLVKEVRPLLVWEDFVNIASSLESDRQTPARKNFLFLARVVRGVMRNIKSRLGN